jgi:AAA family ATP:ADP antiporter
LPLPFELKNKTKSFIDVVIDSIATGFAGFILIFVIKGLELNALYIAGIIIILVAFWLFFVSKARSEYFKTFRYNLAVITDKVEKPKKELTSKSSVIKGMTTVFENGTETQILFMLKKLLEINDVRFENAVHQLLKHPSDSVKTAAIQNMYFLNSTSIVTEVTELLKSDDDELVVATLEYLLLHSNKNSEIIYKQYLDDSNSNIADAALYCLAKEAVDNHKLKARYNLENRIADKIVVYEKNIKDTSALIMLLKTIGVANIKPYHPFIFKFLNVENNQVAREAILAAGTSMNSEAIPKLLQLLPKKELRKSSCNYSKLTFDIFPFWKNVAKLWKL